MTEKIEKKKLISNTLLTIKHTELVPKSANTGHYFYRFMNLAEDHLLGAIISENRPKDEKRTKESTFSKRMFH